MKQLYIKSAILMAMIFTLFSTISSEPQPNHSSHGIHGMVLMNVNGHLLASHLPLHNSKHAHQILLHLSIDDPSQREKVLKLTKNSLTTVMPVPFALMQLHTGALSHFAGQVFEGHFERGGNATLHEVNFKVEQIIYHRPLNNIANGDFAVVRFKGSTLLVHQIGIKPSFDQIIQIKAPISIPKSLTTGTNLPLSLENWPQVLSNKGIEWQHLLYLETQDFQ